MPEWTPQQAQAIDARAGLVLCDAAAGSGKTAVLTERVLRLLTDPVAPIQVGQLLVVTFTRAAAAEMRQRIERELRRLAQAAPPLARLAWLLPQADITTVHGFCERTLRRHFAAQGLDPAFRVLDGPEADACRDDCLERLLIERSVDPSPGLRALISHYGGGRPRGELQRLAIGLHTFMRGVPDPGAWLEQQSRDAAVFTPQLGISLRQRRLQAMRRSLVRARRLAEGEPGLEGYARTVLGDIDLVDTLARDALDTAGWDQGAQRLRTTAFPRLAPKGKGADDQVAERIRNLRDGIREELKALASGPLSRPWAELVGEAEGTAPAVQALCALVADLDAAYAAAKSRLHALDFADLEFNCLALLRSPAAAAVRGRYREVLVDEAQDLSPVQDALLMAVAEGRGLFLVGDVRQSIYGFRLAEPRRLLAHAERCAAGEGILAPLTHNFRSRPPILEAIHALFGTLFLAAGSGVPPQRALPMVAGAPYAGVSDPVRIVLLNGDARKQTDWTDGEEGFHDDSDTRDQDSGEGPDSEAPGPAWRDGRTTLEREAEAVADLICSWLEGSQVQEAGGWRPVRPGDVAVLLRALRGSADVYASALQTRGLPVWTADPGGHADSREGRDVLAWLRALDNPRQDIHLAAALRGPFGCMDDSDLAAIRLAAPGAAFWQALRACAAGTDTRAARATAWLADFERWRTLARSGRFSALLRPVLERSAPRTAGLPSGKQRQRTLQWLMDECRRAESDADTDLARLITRLEHGGRQETVAEAAAAAGDAVRILSIHGSKGLEFPCVVVAALGRRFHGDGPNQDILLHRSMGVGARAVDLSRLRRWPTLRHAAVQAARRDDERAEELRTLYVALTRAREHLALVGTAALPEAAQAWALAARSGEPPDLAEGSSWLSWIGPCLAAEPALESALARAVPTTVQAGPWHLHIEPPTRTFAPSTTASAPGPVDPDPGTIRRLEAEVGWTYPWAAARHLAGKRSVGELREVLADGEQEPAAPDPDVPQHWPSGHRPAVDPVELGQATHLVQQRVDAGGPCDLPALRRSRDALVAAGTIPGGVGAAIDLDALARFWSGPLGLRLRHAATQGHLRREVPFTLRHGIDRLAPGEWVLVQGVIDALAVEPDGLLLVDYKTDRLAGRSDRHEATTRYGRQLRLYATAAAAAWGCPVREAWIVWLAMDHASAVALRPEPGPAG